ncbi:VWA domain-containing protein [candidate division KSB1 bacterium]|nr:VWA domain-containing protein [candidate division KSB1 bacterium]
MQKYIFIFFILTTAFLGCRSTQKPVQVEKGPERQVEVPKVDDSKKDAQKHQEVDKPVKTEEWVVTDMAFRERKGKNMPLQSFQLLSKSVAAGNFTTAKPDILPIPHNTEEYSKINDNVFLSPGTNPLSTFSIDVDAASYANVRRFLNSGQLPYKDAVRIEELVNYFNYDYEDPKGEHPFSVTTEVSQAPWNPDHKLVHIGLQGKKLDYEDMKPSNLVFLVDVSGSMKSPNKLSLLKSAFKLLVKNLDDRDRIAIVAYAGAAGLVLPSTPAKERSTILSALDKLEAGGSTAGGAGIKLAYKVAKENLIEDGNNRVILATDGDFNVGVSSTSELVRTIEEKRDDGIFLTICGFGMGNYKDGRMESISNAGNGNYFYIDNILEAEKVFVKEMRATLFTIAKDVKIQIEFNPAKVQAYRLIGYENRMLKSEDFNDDKKDAGELGAGHTVTALYEIIPVGVKSDFIKSVDELKYQKGEVTNQASSDELMTVKLRYKRPKEDTSRLLSTVIKDKATKLAKSSDNFRFASAVAEFGMLLRDSEFKGQASYENVLSLANSAKGSDSEGYRSEFVQLVKKASLLALN